MLLRLFKQSELAAAILDTIGAVVCVMEPGGKIVFFNQACQKLTGYTEDEVLDRYPWDFFILPAEMDMVKTVFKKLTLGNFPSSNVNYWLTKSGSKRLLSWTNTALADENGNIRYIIATGIDITEQRQAEEQIARYQAELEELVARRTKELHNANKKYELLAYHDALTGLYNRRYFNVVLENEMRRTRRIHESLTLVICAVDFFRKYNDTYGSVAGDKCIQEIADIISSHFQRASDLVARYGSDAFGVILRDMSHDEVSLLSEQLRIGVTQLKIKHVVSPIADHVTISIGIVTSKPGNLCDAETLVSSADKALATAQEYGGNYIESTSL